MFKQAILSKTLALSFALVTGSAMASAPAGYAELGVMQGFPPAADKQVKPTNWVAAPYNRWAFQNLSAIIPTTPVRSGKTIEWPVGTEQDFLNLEITDAAGETVTVEDVLDSHYTDAFVVLHKGEIIQERYWNGMTADTQHWMASMTKLFTGLLAEILIDKGVLERDKTAADYVPALKDTAMGTATIGQLLDMTGGTEWDESYEAIMNPESFARQYGNATGTWPMEGGSEGVFGILPKIEQERPHGQSFKYNAPQTDVMGWVMSSATGKRLEDLISEHFWYDLGAENHAYMMVDSNTYAWATGGLTMTARDVARFGQLIANNGKFNGKQVFPARIMKPILDGDAETFAKSAYGQRIPGGAYSSYFWLTNNDDGAVLGKGIYSQYLYINPAKDVVIVRYASPVVSGKPEYDLDMIAVFTKIADQLTK